MKLLKAMVVASIGLGLGQMALAGASEYDNVKLPCAILKDGKVLKQQICLASGFEHGNMYGGGYGWSFSIQGYGKIRLDAGTTFKTDANDELMVDKHGEAIEDESWTNLNGKPANIRLRMPKTFVLLNEAQENQYYEGELNIRPYTCWYFSQKTHMAFDEVCYFDDSYL